MFNRKLIALSLGIASLSLGTSGAYASTIVGNPSQDNNQSATTNQGANQTAGGTGVVVGPTVQAGVNANSTTQGNVQAIGAGGPGSTTVGNPSQHNTQGAATTQQVNQASGGGVVIGPTVQLQANLNATTQASVAIIF